MNRTDACAPVIEYTQSDSLRRHMWAVAPAKLSGVSDRVGTIEVGKDGDLALYDGDPFEYTSHCVGVVIDGRIVSEAKR